MLTLIAGLVIFFGTHLYATFRSRETGVSITDRIGYSAYMGVYSVVSFVGLALIAFGFFSASAADAIYHNPFASRSLTLVSMAFASIFVAAAYVPANHIAGKLKHPMLVGIALWAGSHLLAGSEPRDVLLFGAFLAFAIINIAVVNRRTESQPGQSNIATLGADLMAIVVGLSIFALFGLWVHAALFGVTIW